MRARLLKPQIQKNEDLARLGDSCYKLFTGLWQVADRDGRLEDRPLKIKGEIAPYHGLPGFPDWDIEELLGKLHDAGFIIRYEVGGRKLIQVTTWEKHAKCHREEPSLHLPPPSEDALKPKQNGKKPGDFPSYSSSSFDSSSIPPNPPSGGGRVEEFPAPTRDEFVSAWNAITGFTGCREFNEQRQKYFRARCKNTAWRRDWREALDKASRIPFCLGRGEKGWIATIDWFLRSGTVGKILEGVYDRLGLKGGPPPRPKESPSEKVTRLQAEREKAAKERQMSLPISEIAQRFREKA